MEATPQPIVVPPLDPEAIARALAEALPRVQAELRALEDAKRVSRKTMEMVITW